MLPKFVKRHQKYLCPIHFKVDVIAALNISDYQRETEHIILWRKQAFFDNIINRLVDMLCFSNF